MPYISRIVSVALCSPSQQAEQAEAGVRFGGKTTIWMVLKAKRNKTIFDLAFQRFITPRSQNYLHSQGKYFFFDQFRELKSPFFGEFQPPKLTKYVFLNVLMTKNYNSGQFQAPKTYQFLYVKFLTWKTVALVKIHEI